VGKLEGGKVGRWESESRPRDGTERKQDGPIGKQREAKPRATWEDGGWEGQEVVKLTGRSVPRRRRSLQVAGVSAPWRAPISRNRCRSRPLKGD